jgi:hypothetical protein
MLDSEHRSYIIVFVMLITGEELYYEQLEVE